MILRIALCQIRVISDDRPGNFERIESALVDAKKGGADLAVFPESAILGWINPNAFETAAPIPGPDTEHLCQLAKDNCLAFICGLDEIEGDSLFDSAIAISADRYLNKAKNPLAVRIQTS